ncbi:fasciclin domain-containing protein [Mastigocoleus testarum]|uniref:FAS1 domain-containing protein n=1 Tax=Mastigocoleus testarum BC008 TaxID=371196 RepID=A0A0V7ZZM3_9CYAN|nr:fasciclin domain-containing protein [Mastigocoleus testarum]KST70016.1 hypothetical protein BC008_06140 [Mastigocoleus testarum BC008]
MRLNNDELIFSLKSHIKVVDINFGMEHKLRLSNTISLSLGILAFFVFLPTPVKASFTPEEFPRVISETLPSFSIPEPLKQPVSTPIPSSEDDGQRPIPIPIPTTSPSIPQTPENIPEIPQESPDLSLPEDIQPSKPTSDIPDDIPRPVRSNQTPAKIPEKSLSSGNLLEVTATNNSLNLFARAIETAGLTDTLIEDFFTIFVPTNDAFNQSLPAGAMDFLLKSENKYLLQKLLRYHIVKGEVAAKELTTGKLNTLGGSIAIRVTPERIILNNSSITRADIPATNGVIHSINRVLIPRNLRNTIIAKMSERSKN